MKKDIHPNYREVIFHDASSGFRFLTRSTVKTNQKGTWEDGQEYPLVTVDVSAASHPFFTGQQKFVDAAGRVEKFRQKFGRAGSTGYGRKDKAKTETADAQG